MGYPQIAILMGNMVIIHWNMRYTIFRQTHMGDDSGMVHDWVSLPHSFRNEFQFRNVRNAQQLAE
jgi:hypothetical protein